MKRNILIFSLIKNNYINYDKSMMLETLARKKDVNLFTINPGKLAKYQLDHYKQHNVHVAHIDDILPCEDINVSKADLEDICMHSYKVQWLKNSDFSFDIYKFETKELLKKVVYFIRENNIDSVIVWGNSYYSNLVTMAAKICDIKNLILEEGYYRNLGIQASKVGSNYESEFEFLISNTTSSNLEKKEDKIFVKKETLTYNYDERKLESLLEKNNKFILVPLQINADTQILLNSPNFENMYSFVEFIYKQIELFNEKNNDNLIVVFKVHPEHEKQDPFDNFSYIYDCFKEHGIFVEDFCLDTLIERCEFVITINSTVGFQAIDRYKKVIVCGNAIYENAPNALRINDFNDFDNVIMNVKNLNYSSAQVNEFKNKIYDFQLPLLTNSPTDDSINLLLNKLYSDDVYFININGKKISGPSQFINLTIKSDEADKIKISEKTSYIKNNDIQKNKISVNIKLKKFKNIINIDTKSDFIIELNNKYLNNFDSFQYENIEDISFLKYKDNISIDDNYEVEVEFCNPLKVIENNNLFTLEKNNSKILFITFSCDDMKTIYSTNYDFLNFSDHIIENKTCMLNNNAIICNLNSVKEEIYNSISHGDYEEIYFFGSGKYGNIAAYFSKKFPKSKLIALVPVDKFDNNYEKNLFTLDTECLNTEDIFIISNIHENNEKIITTSQSFEEVISYYKENQDQIIYNVGKQKVYYVNLEKSDIKYTLDSLVSKNNNEFIFLQYNSKISINYSDLLLPLNKGVEKKFLSSNPNNVVMNILFHNLNISRSLLYIEFGKKISDQSFVSNWCGAAYLYRLFNLEFNGPFAWGYLSDDNYIRLLNNEINHSGSITISRNAKNLPTGINENGVHMVYNHYVNYDDEKIIELHNSRVAKFNNVLLTFSIANSKTTLLNLIALGLENHIIFTPEEFTAKNVISKHNWKDSIESHIYSTGPWAYVFNYLTNDYNVLQFFEEVVKEKNPDINDYKI